MGFVGKGTYFEYDVISKKNAVSKHIFGCCWNGTCFGIWCEFLKMLVEITWFWASCYFTGHAFELVFDILVHKILKITFSDFFPFEKSFKKCFMAFC